MFIIWISKCNYPYRRTLIAKNWKLKVFVSLYVISHFLHEQITVVICSNFNKLFLYICVIVLYIQQLEAQVSRWLVLASFYQYIIQRYLSSNKLHICYDGFIFSQWFWNIIWELRDVYLLARGGSCWGVLINYKLITQSLCLGFCIYLWCDWKSVQFMGFSQSGVP